MGTLKRRRPWLLLMVLMGLRCRDAALVCKPFVLEGDRVGESNCGGVRLSFHSRLLLLLLRSVVKKIAVTEPITFKRLVNSGCSDPPSIWP